MRYWTIVNSWDDEGSPLFLTLSEEQILECLEWEVVCSKARATLPEDFVNKYYSKEAFIQDYWVLANEAWETDSSGNTL